METVLYFFSGTGNTLYLARKIQDLTSATLIPIASTVNDQSIAIQTECLGIITPVYYADLPNIVKVFLHKLSKLETTYIFLVVNYGGGFGHAVTTAKEIVTQRGGEIAMVYSIHMPQNAFLKPSEKPGDLYARAEKVLSTIPNVVSHKQTGKISTNRFADSLQGVLYAISKPMYRKHLLKLAALDHDASIEETIYKADRTFLVNAQCNGCGTCVRVCPVENITIVEGKPHWLQHCENCLACYTWCPQKAIYGALVAENYYYRHPDLTIQDLIHQKEGSLI